MTAGIYQDMIELRLSSRGALKNNVSNNTGAFALELLGAELPRSQGGRPRQFCPLSPIVRAALEDAILVACNKVTSST